VPIADFVRGWSGMLLRHRPHGSTRSVLDEEYLGQRRDNRWSAYGVRAWYFASDIGVVVAEYGRHIEIELPAGRAERLARSVFEVGVTLDRVLDLTDPATVAAIGASPVGDWILDVRATQSAAGYLLGQIPNLQGLIVPSVAFLGRPNRHNVVVYRDRIEPGTVFETPVFVREVVLEATGTA
jgi:RES domain-containing protein